MQLPKKKFINIRPAVIIAVGLIIGILSAYAYLFANAYFSAVIFSLSIVGCTIATAILFCFKKRFYAFFGWPRDKTRRNCGP